MRFSRQSPGQSLSPPRPACASCRSPCPPRRLPGTADAAAVPSHSGHHVHFENANQSREPVIPTLNHTHVHTGHVGLPGSAGSGQDRDRRVLGRREDKLKRTGPEPRGYSSWEIGSHSEEHTRDHRVWWGWRMRGKRDGGQEMWSSSWRRPVVPCV